MADSLHASSSLPAEPGVSALGPLREPLFRSLWIASVTTYIGKWMQMVGAAWLMTQLTTSPFMVGLVQAAIMLPVFLVILPAGALADIVDRRRFLLATQAWMVIAAGSLGVLTLLGDVTPWILVLFTFLLGLGAVINDPAWQAITPEVASARNHANAVALNSAAFNVARAVGPALAGFIIAATNSGVAFLMNAAGFSGVILFLYRWKRPNVERGDAVRITESLRSGLRYVRSAALVHCVLIRTAAFSVAASSLLALLPVIARPFGASGYGLLLAFFGVGALAGAGLLPHLRVRYPVDSFISGAIVLFALTTFASGRIESFALLSIVLFFAGMAWISIVACLNVAAQTMTPSWMRARAISVYLLVLQGGMALGSAGWGALATKFGVPATMLASAAALIAGLAAVRRYRITLSEPQLTPSVSAD
jgi:MFS family permease